MLAVGPNTFGWSVDSNVGAATEAAFGTALTPGTNVKGNWTNLLSNTAYDAYGVWVCIPFTTVLVGAFIDIGVDPANGTAYQVLIPNLAGCGASIVLGGTWYYFPVFVPKGSSVGVRAQVASGVVAIRAAVRLVGQPSRPDLVRVGSFVRAFNVNTATSYGTTAFVAGISGAWGAFTASLGTTAEKLWAWQVGFTTSDAGWTKNFAYFLDVVVGASSADAKVITAAGPWLLIDSEKLAGPAHVELDYERPIGSGIYVRGLYTGATLETPTYAIVYGVGG